MVYMELRVYNTLLDVGYLLLMLLLQAVCATYITAYPLIDRDLAIRIQLETIVD
jgi:hypothetical protein